MRPLGGEDDSVVIEGKRVGHVPKTDLDRIHEVISQMRPMGYESAAAQAALSWDARGTEIALVDVDEVLFERVRSSTQKQPRIGHMVEVALRPWQGWVVG